MKGLNVGEKVRMKQWMVELVSAHPVLRTLGEAGCGSRRVGKLASQQKSAKDDEKTWHIAPLVR